MSTGTELTVRLIRDIVKLRGIPPQGAGFFHSYYAMFRGRGVLLNSTGLSPTRGLFASVNAFFTATSVLYLGCEASGEHIEAGVLSPTVVSMEAVCSDPSKSLPAWGTALSRSLAAEKSKNPSKFRIEFGLDSSAVRDRDLILHHLDDIFPPAPTASSVTALTAFLNTVHAASRRLMLGGFYVLAVPTTYVGIDLLLSSIAATTSPDRPLMYVGMILYGTDLPLWVFRVEPVNPASLESQRTMASARLIRYPPVLQAVVQKMMPESTQIGSGLGPFEEILASRVTPTDTLTSLFRLAYGPYPREVLNRLGTFQPKYSTTIDKIRSITELKVQVRIIFQLLYDLALASQRRC